MPFKVGHRLSAEARAKIAQAHFVHGHAYCSKGSAERRTYTSWTSMRRRCLCPTDAAYSEYGGRGIRICSRWMSYLNFLEDMGLQPVGKTLDRKDNNKGYSKSNCRWATKTAQARNRRSNRLLTIGGKTKTLVEWANSCGLNSSTIRMRIQYNGGRVDETLLLPVNRK